MLAHVVACLLLATHAAIASQTHQFHLFFLEHWVALLPAAAGQLAHAHALQNLPSVTLKAVAAADSLAASCLLHSDPVRVPCWPALPGL